MNSEQNQKTFTVDLDDFLHGYRQDDRITAVDMVANAIDAEFFEPCCIEFFIRCRLLGLSPLDHGGTPDPGREGFVRCPRCNGLEHAMDSFAERQFLKPLYELCEKGDNKETIDFMFRRIDRYMTDGQFYVVESIAEKVQLHNLDASLVHALFCIMKPESHKIQNFDLFADRAIKRLCEIRNKNKEVVSIIKASKK